MTALLIALVAVPTAFQFVFPSLLPLFERIRDLFLAGDWWRIVTPLVVQDGGISDSVANFSVAAGVIGVSWAVVMGQSWWLR